MEIGEKLNILADAAKYDVSCSSSGSSRKDMAGGLGNAKYSGICHTWTADGRCISLLKILMTNACIYDCEYCVNRKSHDILRVFLSPEEIATLTIEFYRRNYIEGLFLSSGIIRSPDYTTELLIKTARILREREHFNGYIHMKGIPGTDSKLLNELGRYVDRVSVNIELPSEKALRVPAFVPAGQTTQLIVGASGESDRDILRLTEGLYRVAKLKRVYYSAYVPVMAGKNLPVIARPPLLRENRLYQADWLLRYYGFSEEILTEKEPDFDMDLDPKSCWAMRHRELFPVEINRAPYEMILRVPGIGVISARRIVRMRRNQFVSPDDVKRAGAVWKRAKHFVTCGGKYDGMGDADTGNLRKALLSKRAGRKMMQMSLFSGQI